MYPNQETSTHLQVSEREFQFWFFFASSYKEWFSLQVVSGRKCFPPCTKDGTTDCDLGLDTTGLFFPLEGSCCSRNSAQQQSAAQFLTNPTASFPGARGICCPWCKSRETHQSIIVQTPAAAPGSKPGTKPLTCGSWSSKSEISNW